jgi:hypothetical protein
MSVADSFVRMPSNEEPSMSREIPTSIWLVVMLAVFVIATFPLTLISWHVLSEALAGRFEPRALAAALAVGTVFVFAASGLGLALTRLEHR